MHMRLSGIFTRQERLALGFLLGVGLLGMGAQLFRLDRLGERRFIPTPPAVAVNRAEAVELVPLPGIGPVLAKRIVEDRALHGRFLTLSDLKRVKGVTPKVLENIKGLVRFD